MICPQTKQECSAKYCVRRNICFDKSFRASAKRAPPPPTMAEIERLVDAYGVAGGGAENKAALMAAIRAYGRE